MDNLSNRAKENLKHLRNIFQSAMESGDAPMSIDVVDMADISILIDQHIESDCVLSKDLYNNILDKWLSKDEKHIRNIENNAGAA